MRCVRPRPEAYTEDGRRRSDVAIILPGGGQVAIEVQLGELSDAQWLARHHDYDQAAVTDVWVWHRSTWVPRVMFAHRQPGWILDLEHDQIGLLHAQPIPGPGSRTEGPQGCDDMRWPLDGVALFVGGGVKAGGRPPLLPRRRRLAAWSAGSGMVALMPRRRR